MRFLVGNSEYSWDLKVLEDERERDGNLLKNNMSALRVAPRSLLRLLCRDFILAEEKSDLSFRTPCWSTAKNERESWTKAHWRWQLIFSPRDFFPVLCVCVFVCVCVCTRARACVCPAQGSFLQVCHWHSPCEPRNGKVGKWTLTPKGDPHVRLKFCRKLWKLWSRLVKRRCTSREVGSDLTCSQTRQQCWSMFLLQENCKPWDLVMCTDGNVRLNNGYGSSDTIVRPFELPQKYHVRPRKSSFSRTQRAC